MGAIDKAAALGANAKNVLVGVAALGALGLIAYVIVRGPGKAAADAAKVAGQAVGGAVAGGATGIVHGIGDSVGIPRTEETECEKARREGRTFDASKYCDAGTFLGYVFGGRDGAPAQPASPDLIY